MHFEKMGSNEGQNQFWIMYQQSSIERYSVLSTVWFLWVIFPSSKTKKNQIYSRHSMDRFATILISAILNSTVVHLLVPSPPCLFVHMFEVSHGGENVVHKPLCGGVFVVLFRRGVKEHCGVIWNCIWSSVSIITCWTKPSSEWILKSKDVYLEC